MAVTPGEANVVARPLPAKRISRPLRDVFFTIYSYLMKSLCASHCSLFVCGLAVCILKLIK
jgi:hypothetical protein